MSPEIHIGTKSVATPHNSNFKTNSSALFLSPMVTIYHHMDVKVFAKWRWHIWRNRFFHIAIKLYPVKFWKGGQVNVMVGWLKDES
jgi:hypothetical protein